MSDTTVDPTPFTCDTDPPVSGFLHAPGPGASRADAIVLTHGAGSNCQAPLLRALATAFAAAGFTVLRCDLPYRQKRPHGPPFPGEAARDRQGLQNAVEALKSSKSAGGAPFDHVFLGGHSYGGRQATMLAAEHPSLASGLLLTSYPLHPPGQPAKLRTDHFPSLRIDALFVQGASDPFGSIKEIEQALKLIPARTLLVKVEGVGHDLGSGRSKRGATGGSSSSASLPEAIVADFLRFFDLT